MRLFVPVLALLLAAGATGAERHKLDIDPESQDGILLQRIQQEPTAPRKLALLQKFVAQYPKAEGIAWVYEQLRPIYMDAKDYDKVLEIAGKLLALDPDDLDSANDALRSAEAKKDPVLIRKYAEVCWDVASRTVQIKKPADPDDVADWLKQTEFAKQMISYCEYLLYAQFKEESDPQKKADLLQALEKRNPKSKFLAIAKKPYIRLETRNPEEALALAEKALTDDPDNIDMLMTVAQYYMGREREFARVLSCSLHVLELLPKKPKPEGVSDEEWAKKKSHYTGTANWMAGVVYGKEGRYGPSDRHLRASLGYIRDNTQLLAAAYFYLGYDNYAMAAELHDRAHAVEAAKFSKLCLAIDGPFQPLAQKNLDVIRNEYNVE